MAYEEEEVEVYQRDFTVTEVRISSANMPRRLCDLLKEIEEMVSQGKFTETIERLEPKNP